MDSSEDVEVFVMAEQDGAETVAFEVHLADQPPEEGGSVWVLSGEEVLDQETLHDALITGLVTEMPRRLLEETEPLDDPLTDPSEDDSTSEPTGR